MAGLDRAGLAVLAEGDWNKSVGTVAPVGVLSATCDWRRNGNEVAVPVVRVLTGTSLQAVVARV